MMSNENRRWKAVLNTSGINWWQVVVDDEVGALICSFDFEESENLAKRVVRDHNYRLMPKGLAKTRGDFVNDKA